MGYTTARTSWSQRQRAISAVWKLYNNIRGFMYCTVNLRVTPYALRMLSEVTAVQQPG